MAQAKANSKKDVRKHKVTNLWTQSTQPGHFGREQFQFWIDRSPRRLPHLNIDPFVETVTWQRAGANRTGELDFRRPPGAHGATAVQHGDYLICGWSQWGTEGPWRRLWRMKVASPSQSVYDGIITLQLASDIAEMTASKVAWKFKSDKQHPNGWTAHQMTIYACQRFNIPLGKLPKASYRIQKWTPKSLSPQDVITWAWGQERKHTGRRFDIDSSTGTLNVTELAEPNLMLLIGAAVEDGTISMSMSGLASAVIATSSHKGKVTKDKKGHKHQKVDKLRARVVNKARYDRYGYIVKTLKAPSHIQTQAALRDWALRRLATMMGQHKGVEFTHPGIPLVDRGTPLRLSLPEADLTATVFVSSVQHTLSAGSYDMDVTTQFDDPFQVQAAAAAVQRKKDAVATRRARVRAQNQKAKDLAAEARKLAQSEKKKARSNKK